MFKDRLKAMLGGTHPADASGHGAAGGRSEKGPPVTRVSSGLEQFFYTLRDRQGLTLLDFAGASQSNISYITSLGHRLASEDFLRSLDLCFGDGDFYTNQSDTERLARFAGENLDFPDGHFDGALVWDSLEFLAPDLLQATVEQLHRVMHPGALMLAFFHSDEKTNIVQTYHYRIKDAKTLTLVPRGTRKRAQYFNNRGLEKLFSSFATVKFFLTRDNLREIIIKR